MTPEERTRLRERAKPLVDPYEQMGVDFRCRHCHRWSGDPHLRTCVWADGGRAMKDAKDFARAFLDADDERARLAEMLRTESLRLMAAAGEWRDRSKRNYDRAEQAEAEVARLRERDATWQRVTLRYRQGHGQQRGEMWCSGACAWIADELEGVSAGDLPCDCGYFAAVDELAALQQSEPAPTTNLLPERPESVDERIHTTGVVIVHEEFDDEGARMDVIPGPIVAGNSAMVRLSDVSATTLHEDECRNHDCPGCYRPRDGETQEGREADG